MELLLLDVNHNSTIFIFVFLLRIERAWRVMIFLASFSLSLVKLGALEWSRVVREHQGWRLVTCAWLHAGLIHLITNMLSLLFIGIRLEQQFGFGEASSK